MRVRACVCVSPRARWLCSQTLSLRENKIGDDGMRALADALAGGKAPSLQLIRLEGNPGNADPVEQAAPAGCSVEL